jgi:hypothetical protein
MALRHLRSNTADKRPNPAALADGQVALNTNIGSPGLFFKDSNGALVKVGPVHVGATAPNVTPASGGTAGNSKGEAWLDTSGTNPLLKVWGGSAWQTVQPVVNGNVVSTADTGTVTSTMIADGTIVNADINASAAIVDTKLATIATAGKVSNSATTATSTNTNSAIVARDGSGNFSAGTITAALTGNAATATKLNSNRTFALTGQVTGTVSSDLTAGASIATTIASGTIVNADVNAAADIAPTKIAGTAVVTADLRLRAQTEESAIRQNAAFSVGKPGAMPYGVGPVIPPGMAFAGIGPDSYNPVHLASGSFC